jgi:uncharacterized protein YciI
LVGEDAPGVLDCVVMQFLVCGHDGDDDGALERRTEVRAAHLALGDKMAADGKMLFAVALLDGDGDGDGARMVGSAIIVDVPSRDDVDRWLEVEPYVVGDVWRRIEVTPCRVGPRFAQLLG